MLRSILAPAMLVLSLSAVFALPKVAVLDALVSSQMNPSVIVPITEKVVEQLVSSGEYLVLDRANVESILKEREFQFTGLVSDSEISQAGRYLGAELVVVIRVEMIGDTYFISSRMISVETGIIMRQASAEGEGKLSVLLAMAGRVGLSLTSKGVAQTAPAPAAARDSQTAITTAPVQTQAPAVTPAPAVPSAPAKNAAMDGIGGRLYFGISAGTQEYNDSTHTTEGFDLYMIIPLENPVCLTTSFTFADGSADGGLSANHFDIGIGLALPLGFIMPWASAKVGFAFIDSSDYSGLEYGYDVGVDIRLGIFLVGVRYQVQYTAYEYYLLPKLDTVTAATIVMVGLRL